ncbi:MAG TPA: hypothetical protein VNA87_00820, partial [Actinomycetota bacterium]|nr:hypothetical protein [Actinomycetota bacterium]
FDNFVVQVLPPQITFDHNETFNDGVANLFTGDTAGTWLPLAGRYSGAAAGVGYDLVDLGIGRGLRSDSYLEIVSTFSVDGIGGLVFDYYGPDRFKFVAIDVRAGRVIIGHKDPRRGWVVDGAFARTLVSGTDYTLQIVMKGTAVSITLNGAFVTTHAFNAGIVDGSFGLITKDGTTSFDVARIRTDDPAFIGSSSAQIIDPVLAAPEPAPSSASRLDEATLAALVAQGIASWKAQLGADHVAIANFEGLRFAITDLADGFLGQTHIGTVYLDVNASGYGWAVAPALAADGLGQFGSVDAMQVVMHELGHILGLEHEDADEFAVMSSELVISLDRGTVGGSSTPSASFAMVVRVLNSPNIDLGGAGHGYARALSAGSVLEEGSKQSRSRVLRGSKASASRSLASTAEAVRSWGTPGRGLSPVPSQSGSSDPRPAGQPYRWPWLGVVTSRHSRRALRPS